jgi:hypothetical protein
MNWNTLVFWLMVLIAGIVFVMSSVVESRAQDLNEMTPSEAAIMCYVSVEAAARYAENDGVDVDRRKVKAIKNFYADVYAELEGKSSVVVRALAMVREEQVFRELRETPLALFVLLAAAKPCINGYNSVN